MSAAVMVGQTRDGSEWTPNFIQSLDASTCIGCGRCYKVCSRDVFELVSREDLMSDDDEDDDFDDDENAMVMSIANAGDCIGCEACSKVCPKDCHSHAPADAA